MQKGLEHAVVRWPTPSIKDVSGGAVFAEQTENGWIRRSKQGVTHGAQLHDVAKTLGGSLNPDWCEWLMGLPIGWTDIEADPVEHPGWDDDPAEVWPTPKASIDGTSERTLEMVREGEAEASLQRVILMNNNGSDRNIPRLTTRKQHKVNRLKACGNGVVPQQAALALRLLLGI